MTTAKYFMDALAPGTYQMLYRYLGNADYLMDSVVPSKCKVRYDIVPGTATVAGNQKPSLLIYLCLAFPFHLNERESSSEAARGESKHNPCA